MTIFENFFSLGLIIAISSFSLMIGAFTRHFTDLRKLIPRLFDEYKQDELSENLAQLDKSLEKSARLIYFSGFFFAVGIFLTAFSYI